MIEVAHRRRGQAPPPWVVWEALTAPERPWLVLSGQETPPRVLAANRPERVVWSSLWPDRPDDHIAFTISADGSGSDLRWTLYVPEADQPTPEAIQRMRYRLNVAINSRLRAEFDL